MRRDDSFDRTSLGASLGIHAVALGLTFWGASGGKTTMFEFVSYQIEIVSPPPVRGDVEQSAQEELVIETPDPAPVEPEKPAPVVEEKPKPREPAPRPTPTTDPVAAEAEERRAGTSTTATDTAGPGGTGINIRMEGLRRDYPKYYDNIVTQIQRCFRWQQGGRWETTVYFVIHRDGTVTDLDFVKRSGNAGFDFEAMGAVDCAGKGRFGALPEDFEWDVLPIQFSFRPTGTIRQEFPQAAPTTPGETASER